MSARHHDHDYERYLELADREACDELLTPEERAFCRAYERREPEACPELTASQALFHELSQLNAAPDASSRALVDRTLAQLEAEDAARASEEVKLLRRRRFPGLGALVAVAAFALGSGYALIKGHPSSSVRGTATPLARAELVYTSGVVQISDTNGPAGRTLLSEGSVIATRNGGACVLIDSDINICLAAHSRMRLRDIAGPARVVDLETGKLATRLATQPEGMSLSIVADGVASTAIGTAFSVERRPDSSGRGSVATTVLNGKVRVGRESEVVVVSAHERAVTRTRGPAAKPTISSVRRTEEAPSWALLGPTVLWHDPVAATLEVEGEPVGAEAWLDDQWLGTTPVSSLVPAGDHRLSVRKRNRELLSRDLHLNAGDSQAVRYQDEATAPAREGREGREEREGREGRGGREGATGGYYEREESSRGNTHVARRSRAREHNRNAERAARSRSGGLAHETDEAASANETDNETGGLGLRQARQAVRAGQFRAAAALYEQLAEGGASSEEASTAMVLLGQLRLNQLNDPRGALVPLNTYLKRGGPLAVEARVARIEALRRLNRSKEEASAIQEFLRLHPRSFEVKRLQARLDALRSAE